LIYVVLLGHPCDDLRPLPWARKFAVSPALDKPRSAVHVLDVCDLKRFNA